MLSMELFSNSPAHITTLMTKCNINIEMGFEKSSTISFKQRNPKLKLNKGISSGYTCTRQKFINHV